MKAPKIIRKWYSKIGAKGGKASGPAKARGDSDYYRNLRKKRTTNETLS